MPKPPPRFGGGHTLTCFPQNCRNAARHEVMLAAAGYKYGSLSLHFHSSLLSFAYSHSPIPFLVMEGAGDASFDANFEIHMLRYKLEMLEKLEKAHGKLH